MGQSTGLMAILAVVGSLAMLYLAIDLLGSRSRDVSGGRSRSGPASDRTRPETSDVPVSPQGIRAVIVESADRPTRTFPTSPRGPQMSLPSEDDPPETRDPALDEDDPPETRDPFDAASTSGDTPPLPLLGRRYQCDRKLINQGGMAITYEAHDAQLPGRRAIVKIVKAKAGQRLSSSKRDGLLHEARKTVIASEANQDYFALVYDVGYDPQADWAWFAMQKLPGETLREKLDARKRLAPTGPGMDVKTACWLTIEILRGLEILHSLGMLHGDIKPANIMWTTDAKVKLLDLGLAKFLHLVNENVVVSGGTLRYLAPEVFLKDEQDRRIDLFAVGVVLYELLMGDLPTSLGSSEEQTGAAHQRGCIPRAAGDADIPEFCKEVIAKAAAANPDRRYQTAQEFLEALDVGLGEAPTEPIMGGAKGGRRPPGRKLVRQAVGLVATLSLGVGLAFWFLQKPPPPILPPPPIDYRGECDVHVTYRDGATLDKRPVLGGASKFLRTDDRVFIDAKLLDRQKAYFYVLQIDSRGRANAIFPPGWARGQLPPTESARADLRIPELGDMPMNREAFPGLETLIWFVRPEPLTVEQNVLMWDACLGTGFPWQQPKGFEKVFVPFINGKLTEDRGFDVKGTEVSKDPVSQAERVLLTLKNKGVTSYSRAMCYPLVAPKIADSNIGKNQP